MESQYVNRKSNIVVTVIRMDESTVGRTVIYRSHGVTHRSGLNRFKKNHYYLRGEKLW